MPYSSGTFSRVHDFTDDRDNGIRIQASRMDAEMDGIATGLSTALLKDGTQTATAKIPFAVGLSVIDNQTILLGTNSDIAIQYDETTNDSLEIAANVEGAALGIVLKSDQGDDNADQHKLSIADGGTLTLGSKISGSFVTYLTHTPNATVTSSTLAVAGNLTVGGNLTLGSGAELSEAELEQLDGITAGTVTASKAVVVDANKDIASFRNITLTGELDAGSLDVSGDADIDGTLEADAITIGGTAIGSIFSPIAGGTGIVTTGALDAGSITSNFGTINNGASAITTTGVGTFGSLDISGDIDVDGTTNLDVVDIDGTLNVQGETTLQTHLNMGDNDIIKLGAGADLQIYHDASNSYINDGGTGNLFIGGTNLYLRSATGENYLGAVQDGALTLYYDNAAKLATTSTGIDVTGTVTASGLTVEKADNTSSLVSARYNSSNRKIGFNVNNSNGQGFLAFNSNSVSASANQTYDINGYAAKIDFTDAMLFDIAGNGTAGNTISFSTAMKINNNGDISFYEDTGTTPKFFWDASAERLGIGTTSPSANAIHAVGSSSMSDGIILESQGVGDSEIEFRNTSSGNHTWAVGLDQSNSSAFGIGYANASGASLSSDNVVTINTSGNVGIGTSSPSNKLEVHSGAGTNIVAKSTNGNGGYLNYSGLSSSGTTTFSVSHNGRVFAEDGIQFDSSGEVLDSYEEGTWSISYTGTGYGSMANLDGSSNGVYRKVGDIVYFSIKMTATTALAIDPTVDRGVFYGLPFTSGSGSSQVGFVSGFMTTSSGFNQGATFTGAVSQGAQGFQLWCSQEHAATNLTYIVVSGMYHV